MPDTCPRCERPLTEDGHLRYCEHCGYEPPESAILPVTPPRSEDGDDVDTPTARTTSPRPATKGAA